MTRENRGRKKYLSSVLSIQNFLNPIFLFIFYFSFISSVVAESQEDLGPVKNYFKIDKIMVEGNKKVEAEAIQEKIRAKEGMVLDNYLLRRDIKTIYSMKYFDFVEAQQIEKNGQNILLFKVKEKPIIKEISFEGNDEMSRDDLKEKIKTKEFTILDINSLKLDTSALQKFYEEKGYYLANVQYEIVPMSDENIKIVFKIQEYDKVKVKKVTFLGNRAFNDDQLKAMMETREDSLLSFMSGAGSFKEFNFETDIERLKYFYKTKGFLQVNIGRPDVTVSEDKRWIFITIKVNEGPKFRVNQLFFEGELLFSEQELREKISLKEDEIYSEETLRLDIQALTEAYQDEGYAFANVLRTLKVVPGENKVDIIYTFEKGKLAYFGKITMKGNLKTRDKVIRRELKIREGVKYSGSLLRQSKENVNRLGFFEPGSVVFNTISPKGKDDVLDVEISIKETNTGQISMGAGYSTASGGFLQASVAQKNFRGLGQELSFTLNMAKRSQDYRLGFIEPYLFDTQWTAGGDIFRTKNESSRSYDSLNEGFNTRVGHPIAENTRLFMTYKLENTELTNVKDVTIDANLENGIASSVELSLIRDLRNHRWEPSKGYYAGVSVEYAGIGGDHKWLKSVVEGRYFRPVVGDLVFRSRLMASRLDQVTERKIPRSQKFTLGGARNLRGFNFEDIGPLADVYDPATERTLTFNQGGLFSVYGTLELEHPLIREAGLKWVAFVDAGNVYRKYIGENSNYALRADYGFGFRWFSPIGPLRFEFGFPINKKKNEDSRQFHFDIGQLF